ncbi:type VI secretion system lipoprotein TssJ [Cognatiyoonia sp. IB215182]|uniref:type VI secretion system lipoprotein TssJ n=1 Tax=Cognatiyoonia sp. IB215182 TaxID=3097353 RepID=UPI002A0BEF84|nr:type VI secretion system lipoprotein TssJ [Cognatiyoonia sp. IB215182]MDX8355180.1 type VI secretion system lipoprotein TssJ [Cognatiyoonia sp. IB215182]
MMRWLAFLAVMALSACGGGGDEVTGPVNKTLSVQAGPNVNQYNDASNPVVIRLYQLSTRSEFEAATFFEIFDDSSPELAGVVLDRRSLSPLFPGETRLVAFDLVPDAFFLGAFAEFADFERQNFRAAVPIDADRLDNGVTVSVTASGISIEFRNPSDAVEGERPGFFGRILEGAGGLLGLGG